MKSVFSVILMSLLLAPAAQSQQMTHAQAKKLFEEAYVLMNNSTELSLRKLTQVIEGIPSNLIYHCKARMLKAQIEGTDIPDCDDSSSDTASAEESSKPAAKNRKVQRLIAKATKLIKEKRYNEAIVLTARGLKIEPNSCDLNLVRGVGLANLGKRRKAARFYEKFVEHCPKNPKAPGVRRVLQQFREYEKANNE